MSDKRDKRNMFREVKKKMRYDEAELALIKKHFAENDELIHAVRRSVLQLPLSAYEKTLLDNLRADKDTGAVIQRMFVPVFEGDEVMMGLVDLWSLFEMKDLYDEFSSDVAMHARNYANQYIEGATKELVTGVQNTIVFSSLMFNPDETAMVNLSHLNARKIVVDHFERMLAQTSFLAGQKEETVEETLNRNIKNSNK